jgi:hypothetical protein
MDLVPEICSKKNNELGPTMRKLKKGMKVGDDGELRRDQRDF